MKGKRAKGLVLKNTSLPNKQEPYQLSHCPTFMKRRSTQATKSVDIIIISGPPEVLLLLFSPPKIPTQNQGFFPTSASNSASR